MNLYKYKSGPGLDLIALQQIKKNLDLFDNNINILEFGSGFSTEFFVDYKVNSGKNVNIDSFDNDPNYCYKNKNNYKFLNLNISPLISCSDENFNKQLNEKKYDKNYFKTHVSLPYNHPKFWRQRNCFYNINTDHLKNKYDLILIDGPNGNGRNIAYLHIKDRLKKGSIVFIDDHTSSDNDFSYNFVENFLRIIEKKTEKLYECVNTKNPSWENGNNFIIFKIIE